MTASEHTADHGHASVRDVLDHVSHGRPMHGAHLGNWHPLRDHLWRSLGSAAVIGLGLYFLIPQLAGLRDTADAILHAQWWLPLTLVTLEAASLACYGQLLVTTLRGSGQPVEATYVQRSTLVGNSLGRAMPAGSAASLAIVVAGFHARGMDGVKTATALWGAGMLSSAVLALLLPIAALIGLIGGHLGRIGMSAIVAAIAVLAITVLLPVALRHPDAFAERVRRILTPLARGPLRGRLHVDAIAEGSRRGAENLSELASDRRLLAKAAAWAVANWLLDAAVVVVLALTIGVGTPVSAILLAFVVAQVAAAIPLTPGGVGIVETAMIGTLVASGAPAAAATATVFGWRLISHWLPIPFGLLLVPTLGAKSEPAAEPA
ncbi:MAG TPA: YbhN family protein [Nitriliruptoraceae bacterium]|nr:YbhN family protein [Nitriliruptoraceae bacterium]